MLQITGSKGFVPFFFFNQPQSDGSSDTRTKTLLITDSKESNFILGGEARRTERHKKDEAQGERSCVDGLGTKMKG